MPAITAFDPCKAIVQNATVKVPVNHPFHIGPKKSVLSTESELITMNLEFSNYYLSGMADNDVKLQEKNKDAAGGWMVHAMYFSMGKEHDYRDVMKNVTAPVLVVHNGNDMQPEERTKIYAEAFPNSRFEVIEGANHFSYKQQTGEFTALLKQFLRDNI